MVSDYIDYDEKFFLTKKYKKTCKEYLFKTLYSDVLKYNIKNYIIDYSLIYDTIYKKIFPYLSNIVIDECNMRDSVRLNEIVMNLINETKERLM